jgi:hypothetical protein
MEWKEYERKRLGPILRQYDSIPLETQENDKSESIKTASEPRFDTSAYRARGMCAER